MADLFRALPAGSLVAPAGLLEEVAAIRHPRQFHQPPQRDLAPLPARLRTAQGGDELVCLRVERALNFRQRPKLLAEHAVRLDPRLLDLPQPRLIRVEQFLHRLEERFELRLALLERAG